MRVFFGFVIVLADSLGKTARVMEPDARPLTEDQRKKLSEMMYYAFLEIRLLGGENAAKQASDLADAFHNLPLGMWTDTFSLLFFRDSFLSVYQKQYPEKRARDYVAMVNEVIAMSV